MNSRRRRANEGLFENLLESAPDGIVVVDLDGVIRLVNRQTEAMFGYSRDELLGAPLEMLVPERIVEHHLDLLLSFFAHPSARPMGAGIALTARRKGGSEFPVDIALSPLETE